MDQSATPSSVSSESRRLNYYRSYWYLGLAFLVLLCVQVMPYLLLYDEMPLLIHDNLDSSFVYFTMLAESGLTFAPNDAIVEPFMGGMRRGSMPLELSFTTLWFSIMHPLNAYILERAIQAIVAFVGMFFLLRRHIIPGERNDGIQVGVALAYGMLPFWPFGALSVSGLPGLFYVFLELRAGRRAWYLWAILALFPLYAWLTFSGVFFIAMIGGIALFDIGKERRINWSVFGGLTLLSGMFVVTHYRLFLSFLISSDYVSHRTEMKRVGTYTLQGVFEQTQFMFSSGQYHAHSLHSLIIMPTVLLSVILIFRQRRFIQPFTAALIFIIITSFWYRFWQWEGITAIIEPFVAVLPVNMGRFHLLHPMLWYILFALSLVTLKVHRAILAIIIAMQLLLIFLLGTLGNINNPGFDAFFAEEQFAEIQLYIDQPLSDYRVVSIGIHPSVALYNGFYTVDGYNPDYPLAYKHAFRDIIAAELQKNENLRIGFDDWGSRAYIYIDELGTNFLNYRGNSTILTDLDLNIDALHMMGAQYIISAVRIDTDQNPEYRFLNAFIHDDSAWDIYLYAVVN